MAIQSETKTINGHSYQCAQFTARHGQKLLGRFTVLAGPLLGGLLGAAGGKGSVSVDLKIEDVAGLMQGLAKFSPDEFTNLSVDLLAQSQLDGKVITAAFYDDHYAGNYGELFQALGFVLLTNYKSVFGASVIGNLSARIQKMVSDSPQEDSTTK